MYTIYRTIGSTQYVCATATHCIRTMINFVGLLFHYVIHFIIILPNIRISQEVLNWHICIYLEQSLILMIFAKIKRDLVFMSRMFYSLSVLEKLQNNEFKRTSGSTRPPPSATVATSHTALFAFPNAAVFCLIYFEHC